MSQVPEFELQKAHHFFSADCFNRAWEYIDKLSRTPEEQEAMLLLSMTSLWHWTQRKDVTPTNISIGYWQVARVYTLMGQLEYALHYGQLCLRESQKEGVAAFCLGFAYEALARAEARGGNREKAEAYKQSALQICEKIEDKEDKDLLLSDLATI